MPAEAYRSHFLLGLALGVAGVLLWPFHQWGWIPYPLLIHRHLMLEGLFLSFVTGFLMTAAPRMSGTEAARPYEILASLSLILISSVAALSSYATLAEVLAGMQVVWLLLFLARRIRRRKANPPLGFIFVPFGLGWFLYGILGQIWAGNAALTNTAIEQAFLLNLIVGIGSRLVPFLTRAADLHPGASGDPPQLDLFALALALNASFFLPLMASPSLSAGTLLIILFLSAWRGLALFKPMKSWTCQGVGIRISIWAMLASQLAIAVYPENRLALIHILFIGGYALLTLMIATRVVLAHGGHSMAAEIKSPWLIGLTMLLILTAIARAGGWLMPASALWLLACAAWFWEVGRKAFPKNSFGDSRC